MMKACVWAGSTPFTLLVNRSPTVLEKPPMSTTRRRFIEILPLGGVALLAACSKAPEPAPAPAPMPAPPPAPAAAPAPAPEPAPAAAPAAPATSGGAALVDPSDPTAVSLGYVAVASQVDKAKFPKYADGQRCDNCQLYTGAAGSASGPCPLFGGKLVAAAGWCSAYAKKA
jgi:hypothetical protein